MGTVPVAAVVTEGVTIVHRPKKAVAEVAGVTAEIETFLEADVDVAVVTSEVVELLAEVAAEIETFLAAIVMEYGFVVPDLYLPQSR